MGSYFAAFLVGALTAIFAGPGLIRILVRLKVRQTVRDDVPEGHKAKQGTPTMGGLIIFAGIFAGGIVGFLLMPDRSQARMIAAVALLSLFNVGLGFIDDYLIAIRGKNLGLKARHKLLGQFISAGAFVAYMASLMPNGLLSTVSIPGGISFDLGWAYYPLAVLLIVSMSNAVNLADGLDGLAGGLTAIVGLCLGIFLMFGNSGLGMVCWAIAGGCAGFLWHNSYPAKVFMGDTGALGLGAALGGIAIASKMEIVTLLISAVFIMEALSVTLQVISFKTTGKRIFKMSPIHHHFELCGWPEQKIVVRFWILQILIIAAVAAWVFK